MPHAEESLNPKRLGDLAFLARALSDENRLRILLFLRDGKKSVSQVVEGVDHSLPLVSHHLRELKRALLVEVERKGPLVFYGLSRPSVIELLAQMGVLRIFLPAASAGRASVQHRSRRAALGYSIHARHPRGAAFPFNP